jgi:type I restriction enzyme M protein
MPPAHSFQLTLWDEKAERCSEHDTQAALDKTLLFLGLLYLRYLDDRIIEIEANLRLDHPQGDARNEETFTSLRVIYLPLDARFSHLVTLTESPEIGRLLNESVRRVELKSIKVRGVIPKLYHWLDRRILADWLKIIATTPKVDDATFVEIYLHLMNKRDVIECEETIAWVTPKSIIEAITRMLDHRYERFIDPLCGTGGFLEWCKVPEAEVPLRSVTLASSLMIKGLADVLLTIKPPPLGDLLNAFRQGDSIYEPIHSHFGAVDTVVCNPPFNVRNVDKSKLIYDRRIPFGLPKSNNANYIFIQIIYSALAPNGRACFLMADAASDASGSEREIRRTLVECGVVDVVISLGVNAFGKARVPSTLWILDKGKTRSPRRERVLFIDAQYINHPVAGHDRPLTKEQLEFLNHIVGLYRGESPVMSDDNNDLKEYFSEGKYEDVNSLCRGVTITEISKNRWSLNPRHYLRSDAIETLRKSVVTLALKKDVKAIEAELEKLNERAAELEQITQGRIDELSLDEASRVDEVSAAKPAFLIEDAYRELIRINIRRSVIFESQALSLYRDLFVSFEFPGREGCGVSKSDFGDIPEAWNIKSVGSIANLFVGNKAEEDENYEEVIVIKQPCVRDGVIDLIFAKMYQARVTSDRRLLVNDILVNVIGIGTLGRVAQVKEALCGHTVDSHICVVRPHESITANFLGLALLNLQNYFAGLGTGSAGNQRLRKDTIANTKILLPPQDILEEFDREVSTIRQRATPLLMRNRELLHKCKLLHHPTVKLT